MGVYVAKKERETMDKLPSLGAASKALQKNWLTQERCPHCRAPSFVYRKMRWAYDYLPDGTEKIVSLCGRGFSTAHCGPWKKIWQSAEGIYEQEIEQIERRNEPIPEQPTVRVSGVDGFAFRKLDLSTPVSGHYSRNVVVNIESSLRLRDEPEARELAGLMFYWRLIMRGLIAFDEKDKSRIPYIGGSLAGGDSRVARSVDWWCDVHPEYGALTPGAPFVRPSVGLSGRRLPAQLVGYMPWELAESSAALDRAIAWMFTAAFDAGPAPVLISLRQISGQSGNDYRICAPLAHRSELYVGVPDGSIPIADWPALERLRSEDVRNAGADWVVTRHGPTFLVDQAVILESFARTIIDRGNRRALNGLKSHKNSTQENLTEWVAENHWNLPRLFAKSGYADKPNYSPLRVNRTGFLGLRLERLVYAYADLEAIAFGASLLGSGSLSARAEAGDLAESKFSEGLLIGLGIAQAQATVSQAEMALDFFLKSEARAMRPILRESSDEVISSWAEKINELYPGVPLARALDKMKYMLEADEESDRQFALKNKFNEIVTVSERGGSVEEKLRAAWLKIAEFAASKASIESRRHSKVC